MSVRAVIIQSNYIPWKGYFDLLAQADVVVFLDSVQSTKNDWRNRNLIKTPAGKQWLTIPVRHSNALRIRDVEVAARDWAGKHARSLRQNYARAPHATSLLPLIESWYLQAGEMARLSQINRHFIAAICGQLTIAPHVVDVETLLSDAEHDALTPSDRLVAICQGVQADRYLSGPAASDYLDQAAFARAGIAVEWFDYHGYPDYGQLHGPFDPAVSILDLLLMTGADARRYAIRSGHCVSGALL